VVIHQLQVERRTAKERWPETDVLPLSDEDQQGLRLRSSTVVSAKDKVTQCDNDDDNDDDADVELSNGQRHKSLQRRWNLSSRHF